MWAVLIKSSGAVLHFDFLECQDEQTTYVQLYVVFLCRDTVQEGSVPRYQWEEDDTPAGL